MNLTPCANYLGYQYPTIWSGTGIVRNPIRSGDYFLNIKVGSNLRPGMSGLTYSPMYCCFCFSSVTSPSSVATTEPPCCVLSDNHHVSTCSKPTSFASATVSSSKVLYCFVFATLSARYLPVLRP